MLLQYLIKKNDTTSKITGFKPESDSIKMNCEELKDSDTYLVTFTVDSNDIKAARFLAPLNDSIIEEYKDNCTILENQAAAYFNKTLFPLINDFERLLRKVLYTAKSTLLNKDKVDPKIKEKIEKNIVELEKMEFGPLFDSLFTDENFNKTVKAVVGKANPSTKKQFIELIEQQTENPLWVNFPSAKELCPTLTENFNSIRLMRNDVMHAHNIDAKAFYRAKKLFIEVNEELRELEKAYIPSMNKLVPQDEDWTDSMSASLFEMSRRLQENSIFIKSHIPAYNTYLNTLNNGLNYPFYNVNNVSMLDFMTRTADPLVVRDLSIMPEISPNPYDNLIIEKMKNPESKKPGEKKDE
ncbi:MAG: hypothetical protein KBT21_08885 [Treponema sp.]|nr:hypothetical protein [Candidatus Treponema merdequi]